MSGFGVERIGWSHVHDAIDPQATLARLWPSQKGLSHAFRPAPPCSPPRTPGLTRLAGGLLGTVFCLWPSESDGLLTGDVPRADRQSSSYKVNHVGKHRVRIFHVRAVKRELPLVKPYLHITLHVAKNKTY